MKPPRAKMRPTGAELKGGLVQDSIPILIHERTLRDAVFHARGHLSTCVGGILAGGFYQDPGGPYVEALRYLPAEGGRSTGSTFTFTHEVFRDITDQVDNHWPDLMMVGWHFSQPGMGIFLSGVCAESHRSFFNLPWQFALIDDPASGSLGLFGWAAGRISALPFWLVPADGPSGA